MEFPKMLYRLGGDFPYQGERYTTRVVNSKEEQDAAADFFETVDAALDARESELEAVPEDDSPPTKSEIQQRLTQLGIAFDKRLGLPALTALLPKE